MSPRRKRTPAASIPDLGQISGATDDDTDFEDPENESPEEDEDQKVTPPKKSQTSKPKKPREPQVDEDGRSEDPEYIETYWRVKIDGKRSQDESNRVQVAVNGEMFNLLREEEVVLPQRLLEALDNAVEIQYEAMANSNGRQRMSVVRKIGYVKLREATEAEFNADRADGAKKQKAFERNLAQQQTPVR